MRDLSELNVNEGGRRVKRIAPSGKQIWAFQQHFDMTLPAEYIRLLMYANGGHPELNSIQPTPKGPRLGIDTFYHLNSDRFSEESLWTATEQWQAILGKNILPFADDGGGNQFFLDLSITPASVRLCLHDENFSILEVAPSFEAFIDALSTDPDMI